MVERSKARVCDRSLTGVAGSNPAGDMDVCVVCVAQQGQKAQRGQRSSRDEVEETKQKSRRWSRCFCCVLERNK